MEIYNRRLQTWYSKYAEWVGVWCNSLGHFCEKFQVYFDLIPLWVSTELMLFILTSDRPNREGKVSVQGFSTLIQIIPWCNPSSSSPKDHLPWNLPEEGCQQRMKGWISRKKMTGKNLPFAFLRPPQLFLNLLLKTMSPPTWRNSAQ